MPPKVESKPEFSLANDQLLVGSRTFYVDDYIPVTRATIGSAFKQILRETEGDESKALAATVELLKTHKDAEDVAKSLKSVAKAAQRAQEKAEIKRLRESIEEYNGGQSKPLAALAKRYSAAEGAWDAVNTEVDAIKAEIAEEMGIKKLGAITFLADESKFWLDEDAMSKAAKKAAGERREYEYTWESEYTVTDLTRYGVTFDGIASAKEEPSKTGKAEWNVVFTAKDRKDSKQKPLDDKEYVVSGKGKLHKYSMVAYRQMLTEEGAKLPARLTLSMPEFWSVKRTLKHQTESTEGTEGTEGTE
jgi:hypothetical protein